ncbi:Protein SRG1, partial [Mucuna pruriens]
GEQIKRGDPRQALQQNHHVQKELLHKKNKYAMTSNEEEQSLDWLDALIVNYYTPSSTPKKYIWSNGNRARNNDVEVEPLDHMIDAQNPKLYQIVSLKADDELVHNVPSIPVHNVQEMVPKRFVRSQEELEKVNHMPHLSPEIPVLDLALLSNGNTEELSKLDLACKEWGFFQIVNHGVQKELLQKMKDAASEFFKLPIEEKNKYAMPSNEIQGYGQAYAVSEEQTLDWSDSLMLLTYPTQYRKLQFWPKTPEGFKEITEAYASEVRRVGEELLSSLSVIMGMQKRVFLGLHKESFQGLRVNYYPPCSTPEQVLGLSPHSDTSTITLLMQDDDIIGLEIRHQGGWVPVTPISNALVVNVGDVIEIWSNGKYKSVEHRAVTNKNKSRTSYALFFCPDNDVDIEPLDHMIDAQNPKLYQKVKYGDYIRQSLKRKLEGKTLIDVARIEDCDPRKKDD